MSRSRDKLPRRTRRSDDEPSLPPGYYLDRSDPEVLTLRSEEGTVVARFSTTGYVAASIERAAWEDYERRNGQPPSPLS